MSPGQIRLASQDDNAQRSSKAQKASRAEPQRFTQSVSLAKLVQGTALQGLVPTSPRDYPSYNEVYCASGMPAVMAKPRPFVRGLVSGQDKYAYVSGRTRLAAHTIPAGEMLLIVPICHRNSGVYAFNTTAAGTAGVPVTNLDWTSTGAAKDRTLSPNSFAVWEGIEPQTYFEDSAVVDATLYTALPSATAAPLLKQRMGTRTTVKFSTTYNGQAEVLVVSPGDSPGYVGRTQERHRHVDTGTGTTVAGLGAEMMGSHNTPYMASIAESPYVFAQRAGKTTTIAGNKSAVFHVDGSPDYDWTYWGVLKAAVAADGGTTSFANNFEPRDSIAHKHKMGLIVVANRSTTDALTVYYKSRHLFAVMLQADDGTRSIPALATQMRMKADSLRSHPPPTEPPRAFFPTQIAESEAELMAQHAVAIGGHLAAHGDPIAPSTATTSHQPETETGRAVEAVNDVGAAYTAYKVGQALRKPGAVRSAVSGVRSTLTEIWDGLKAFGAEVGSVARGAGAAAESGAEMAALL